MKKFLMILLCVLLITAATLTTVSATAGSATVAAGADRVKPGETVELVASLAAFPEAEAISVTVEVPTGLTVQSGEWLLEGFIADYNMAFKRGIWADADAADLTQETQVFKLTCLADALPEGQEEKTFEVKFTFEVRADDESKGTVEDTVTVKVSSRENPTGDIDGDTQIDRNDVVRLLLYVTMPNRFPIDAPADFNNDGAVDRNDVVRLLLYVTMPNRFPLN